MCARKGIFYGCKVLIGKTVTRVTVIVKHYLVEPCDAKKVARRTDLSLSTWCVCQILIVSHATYIESIRS